MLIDLINNVTLVLKNKEYILMKDKKIKQGIINLSFILEKLEKIINIETLHS